MTLDEAIQGEAWPRYLAASEQVKREVDAHGVNSRQTWRAVAVAERALADHYEWLAKQPSAQYRAGRLNAHAASLRNQAERHAQ